MWEFGDGLPRFPIEVREGDVQAGPERPGRNSQVDPRNLDGRALSDHSAYDRPFWFLKKSIHIRVIESVLCQTRNIFLCHRISPHRHHLPYIHLTFIPGHALQQWIVMQMPTIHYFNSPILLSRPGSTRKLFT